MVDCRYHFDRELPLKFGGMRIDKALSALCPDFSRAQISRWIRDGSVKIDGQTTKPNAKVLGGERVSVRAQSKPRENWHEAEPLDFGVVYEDADLIVVDKPRGLVVHPGAGNPNRTLVNGLIAHREALRELPRAGVVHRLDKDTTGLMVVAASQRAQLHLARAIAARAVERRYLAVVEGLLERPQRVDLPLGRDRRDRLRQGVRDDGRPAVTHIEPVDAFRAHTLVRARLETGRTHQVRVHLSALGLPLVGDRRYGAKRRLPRHPHPRLVDAVASFSRQALHAARLGFEHPTTHERMEFESALPNDMTDLLAALRADAES